MNPDHQTVINMWLAGSPASTIAEAIGRSRSAVLGIVSRLRDAGHNLPARPQTIAPELRVERRREKARQRRLRQKIGDSTPPPPPEPITMPELSLPPEQPPAAAPILFEPPVGTSILSIGHFQCRAIESYDEEGLAIFCGKPGRPWCPAHRAIYVVAEPKHGRRRVRISARTGINFTGG